MKVVFVHLDLGIGGAEMLVVNAAVAVKDAGHEVTIYTSHHDPKRCFQDTTGDGVLADVIRERGDWLPRHLFGRFTALCAVLRMLWLSLCILWSERSVDAVFCDGVSAAVPLLHLSGPVLFYCHFPDKLLCLGRDSVLKRIYRLPLDMLEEATTGCATEIAVNSKYTAEIFRKAFQKLSERFSLPSSSHPLAEDKDQSYNDRKQKLRVLYPPTNVLAYERRTRGDRPPEGQMGPVVSLNRFERKKNLPLAVHAVGWAMQRMGAGEASQRNLRLVVAGGYDDRVSENIQHLEELKDCVHALGLEDVVEFRCNIPDEDRSSLLKKASCVLYTPSNEHFGIVPVEAMCSEAPVIAVKSGGPLETVVDGKTGFLCEPTPEAFGSAILKLARDAEMGVTMGKEGRQRVEKYFSMKSFSSAFEESLRHVAISGSCILPVWLRKRVLAMLTIVVAGIAYWVAEHLSDRH